MNNERLTIFEWEHHIGTIVPIRQALVMRPLISFYLFLIVAPLFLLNGLFHYLVMCKCMSTTVGVNGTVHFNYFLVMRLNITIVTSCDLLTVILLT